MSTHCICNGALGTDDDVEPATEDVLGRVANCDRDDIKRAIETADLGQKKFYKSTTAAQRGVLLRKWYDAIMENEEDRELPWNVSETGTFILQSPHPSF